ncbi:MAG TPA: aspartyl protease family protein [Chloroflexota bacterium]|nr:aspartyl protease family protein [Chloroflexota bacterium]
MGTFSYPITIIGPAGEATIEPMVDTGATYTVLPRGLVSQLGIKAIRKLPFELGDGRIVSTKWGRWKPCWLSTRLPSASSQQGVRS